MNIWDTLTVALNSPFKDSLMLANPAESAEIQTIGGLVRTTQLDKLRLNLNSKEPGRKFSV